jgi:hypothetical protein
MEVLGPIDVGDGQHLDLEFLVFLKSLLRDRCDPAGEFWA